MMINKITTAITTPITIFINFEIPVTTVEVVLSFFFPKTAALLSSVFSRSSESQLSHCLLPALYK